MDDVDEAAREAIRSSFFTSVSEGTPTRYYLSLKYKTMEEMHAAHSALIAFAREDRA